MIRKDWIDRNHAGGSRKKMLAALLSAVLCSGLLSPGALAGDDHLEAATESPLSVAGPQAAVMEFEVEFFDLDAGEVCDEESGCPSGGAADLWFSFSSPSPNPAGLGLFPFVRSTGAVLPATPFDAVTPLHLEFQLEFELVPQASAMGLNSTALVRTPEGEVFRIGHAQCLVGKKLAETYPACLSIPDEGLVIEGRLLEAAVVFQYERLGSLP